MRAKRAGCQGNGLSQALEPLDNLSGVGVGPALGAELVKEQGP